MVWAAYVFQGGSELIWDHEPDRGPVLAREAHVSPVFQARVECADCYYDCPVIVTVEHGFLNREAMIPGPYDPSFARPGNVTVETLRAQVRDLGIDQCHVAYIQVGDSIGRALVAAAFERMT